MHKESTAIASVRQGRRTAGLIRNGAVLVALLFFAVSTCQLVALADNQSPSSMSESVEPQLTNDQPIRQGELPAGSGDFLNDSLPLLYAIPPNFLRMSSAGAGETISARDDYFDDMLEGNNGRILRFKSMPIQAYINPFPDKEFIACAEKGFQTWQDRTSGLVRFLQLPDPAGARILIVWKHLGNGQSETGCTLGAQTITSFDASGNRTDLLQSVSDSLNHGRAQSTGATGAPAAPLLIQINLDLIMSKSPNIRYRLLQNIVTHELGHALGMLGHSKNMTDMMYPITDEHSRLSDRDVNTIIRLYKKKTQ